MFILRCLRWFLYVEYQTFTRNGASVSGGVPVVKAKKAQITTLWRLRDTRKTVFPTCPFPYAETPGSGGLGNLGREFGKLVAIGLFHARFQAVLGERLGEHLAHFGRLVGIVDLVAADPLADPRLGHALGVADGNAFLLERKVARGRGARVEVLVEPHVGRSDEGAFLPVVAAGRLPLVPPEGGAPPVHDAHDRPAGLAAGCLVGAHRQLGE